MYFNERVVTNSLPIDFDGLPYPRGEGMIMFFVMFCFICLFVWVFLLLLLFCFCFLNNRKGWGIDYLDPLLCEFRRFSEASPKLVGVVVTIH